MFKDNQIIITSSTNKISLLKDNKELKNIKIYSINEFNKLYYFDYDEETIYYIMSNYNVIYEIAKIYLNNLLYIEDKEYKSEKLSFLSYLKNKLITKGLLKINKLFKSSLTDKDIVIYNLPITKELNILIKQLSEKNIVSVTSEEIKVNSHIIYELNSLDDEVVFIANKICELVKKGIPYNKIYLTNLNPEYKKSIKKIFPMFNIPYTLNQDESIYSTFIATKFMEFYESDISVTLEKLEQFIDSKDTEDIYNKIINIINKYSFVEDKLLVKDMIKNDLKNTKLSFVDNINSVHESNLKESIFHDDEYVFVMSFNQGIIPVIYKDESYLTDKEKEELEISLTVDKNNLEKEIIYNKLNSIKNAIITYKRIFDGEEFIISSLNDTLNYSVEKITELPFIYSNLYNKIKLTSLLDEYYKYGSKSSILNDLNNHYQELPYKSYDNTFTGINKKDLHKYLDNKLTLSYSSLDKYFRCPFSFYIGNILKLNIYEETFFQLVGTLFHAILEKFNSSKLSFDELWDEEIKNLNHEFNHKELFFLKKLKSELLFIIDTIKEQEQFTNLHDELHEERVYTSISGDIKITFTGIIDKIKYKKEENETIIAIIDYKTGNPNLDLTTIPYGIGMQLPVYLYLAKNSKKLENVKVAGFYLQKVLNNEIVVDNTHTYEQLKKKNLLLQGFSNEDIDILSIFDTSYQESNIIKSMKTKKDGSFYNYVNVLSSKKMDLVAQIAENKILEGTKKITNAEFNISPKKIEKNNLGCELCKFKDICFHTNKDIEELPKLSKEDVLGGENNG